MQENPQRYLVFGTFLSDMNFLSQNFNDNGFQNGQKTKCDEIPVTTEYIQVKENRRRRNSIGPPV